MARKNIPHRGRSAARSVGFTLIEILVVIGIIALLIGILIPTISRARDGARRTTCMSNMRQLTVAWTEYCTHHDGNMVGSDTTVPGDWVIGGNAKQDIVNGLLFPYCSKAELYHCPADYSDHWRSFSINAYLNTYIDRNSIPPIHHIDEVRRASETFIFVEEFDVRGSNLNAFDMRNSGNSWIDVPAHFHGNGCTVGFCDDHAEFWVYSDPRTLTATTNASQPGNPDLARFEHAAGY